MVTWRGKERQVNFSHMFELKIDGKVLLAKRKVRERKRKRGRERERERERGRERRIDR